MAIASSSSHRSAGTFVVRCALRHSLTHSFPLPMNLSDTYYVCQLPYLFRALLDIFRCPQLLFTALPCRSTEVTVTANSNLGDSDPPTSPSNDVFSVSVCKLLFLKHFRHWDGCDSTCFVSRKSALEKNSGSRPDRTTSSRRRKRARQNAPLCSTSPWTGSTGWNDAPSHMNTFLLCQCFPVLLCSIPCFLFGRALPPLQSLSSYPRA